MIGCFPNPYPDELLYSLCARYSDRVKYPIPDALMCDLSGKPRMQATPFFPSHLDYLVANLPPSQSYTVDLLIKNHTFLPLFAPFLSADRTQQIYQNMRADRGKAVAQRLGLVKLPLQASSNLRFCPHCVTADRHLFGECYWHRAHQVFGVEVCPIHQTHLVPGAPFGRNADASATFISAEWVIEKLPPPQEKPPYQEMLLQLARDVAWLLNEELKSDPLSLQSRYIVALGEQGLLGPGKNIRMQQLIARFQSFYPPALLARFQCELEEEEERSWLTLLLRRNGSVHHPIQHLLLMHCLGYTAAAFFQIPLADPPSGRDHGHA